MAGWVLGRLVSGLGTLATDGLVLPLARQACVEQASCSPLLAASLAWRHWAPLNGGMCTASLATSAGPIGTGPAAGGAAAAAAGGAAGDAPAAASYVTAVGSSAAAGSSSAASLGSAELSRSGDEAGTAGAAGGGGSGGSSSSSGGGRGGSEEGAGAAAPPPPPDPKPELVELLLSAESAGSGPLQRKAARAQVLREFQRHPADTGSPQVMVAMWTHRVRELVRHFDANRKQLPAMRQLEMLVNRRQRMLTWLRRTDFEAYSYTISKLGLKDIYVPTGQSDRYREGMRPGDAVTDDAVNRKRFNYLSKYRQRKSSLWAKLRPRLVTEDPALSAADVAAAAADKLRAQQQRATAASAQT